MNNSGTPYSDTALAIRAAILAADPDCPDANIYDRIINLKKTTDKDILDLFVRKTDADKSIIHGYMYDRITAPHMEQSIASDGTSDALQEYQRWMIFRFYSYIDDAASGRFSTYDFQESIDNVHEEFYGNPKIVQLADVYEIHIDSVITIPIDRTMLAQRLCHFAQTTVTFRHER